MHACLLNPTFSAAGVLWNDGPEGGNGTQSDLKSVIAEVYFMQKMQKGKLNGQKLTWPNTDNIDVTVFSFIHMNSVSSYSTCLLVILNGLLFFLFGKHSVPC